MQRSNPAGAPATDETDLQALMEEPPGGLNYGRKAVDDPHLREIAGRHIDLSVEAAQERDLLAQGGWSIVHVKHGREAGVTAHRGVLHADDYVNDDVLKAKVEEAFGFTFEEVRSVYRQGRLSPAQGELRTRIDARLLALSQGGANMLALARVFGLPVKPARHGGNCRVIDNALARARVAS